MSKRVIVCGSSYSQFPSMESTKRKGYEVVCVSPERRYTDWIDEYVDCDIKEYKKVYKIAKEMNVNGIIVPGTDFPITGAYVSEKMGFPTISKRTAEICSNKYLMRQELNKAGFLVPHFCGYYNIPTNIPMEYPVLVKAEDSMGARGSSLCRNYEELKKAFPIAKEYSRTKSVVVEEFIEGMEFSIDSIVYDGKVHIFGFADRNFFLLPYFIEFGHIVPSSLQDDIIYEVNKVFSDAVKALGINFGAAKGDVKLTNRGVFIVEMAARISGGFLSGWTTPWATGMIPIDFLVDIHMGETPVWKPREKLGYSAERALMSIPGKLKEIIKFEEYNEDVSWNVNKKLPEEESGGVKLLQLHKTAEGSELKFPMNNAFRVGSAISFSKKRDAAVLYAQRGVQNTFFRLMPNQKETDVWIWEDNGFAMFEPGNKETDWHGTSIADALYLVKKTTGIKTNQMNRLFWKYFYKGGAQAATYFYDSYIK
jgi:biotin carboxylase